MKSVLLSSTCWGAMADVGPRSWSIREALRLAETALFGLIPAETVRVVGDRVYQFGGF